MLVRDLGLQVAPDGAATLHLEIVSDLPLGLGQQITRSALHLPPALFARLAEEASLCQHMARAGGRIGAPQ